MTWAGLVTKNLLRRKARTALTVAGVAIGVGLIVALLSITNGVKRTADELIHVGRSDFGLFQSGAVRSDALAASRGARRKRPQIPGVSQVARVFLLVGAVEQSDSSLLFGYVPGEFPERRLVVVAGRRPTRGRGDRRRRSGADLPPRRGRTGAGREAQLPDRRASTTPGPRSSTSASSCRCGSSSRSPSGRTR